MPLAEGSRLAGRYEVLEPLGAGAMGEVYRARDLRLERGVAVKILPETLSDDDEALARFEREAKALAALSHPNILTIHDSGSDGEVCFVVTELLEGETLRARLDRGRLAPAEAVDVGVAVAEGLAGAHSRGVVHRDVKPENIFLTAAGGVKILDFGLARRESPALPAEDGSGAPTLSGTQPGTLLGTLAYMSPEQLRGQAADARSDIFALGCVLFEMVKGSRPFQRETVAETIASILRDDPSAERVTADGLPGPLSRVILKCLAKDRSARYQSAKVLAVDLRSAARAIAHPDGAADAVPAPAPPSRPARRRRRPLNLLAVLPFANVDGDAERDYLIDGLTEGLIGDLAKVHKLRVMARSTVYRYKGKEAEPRAVGRDLGVEAVLTGRVSSRGEALRIAAELVDASDGSLLWSGQFEEPADRWTSLQEQILKEVTGRLLPARTAPARLPRPATASADAYQLYLKGRYQWNRRPHGTPIAIELFEEAIALDPGFALAYASLADCYWSLGASGAGTLPPSAVMPRAKAAAQKAVELDGRLAEAHASLANITMHFDWDWPRAEAALKRALRLDPRSPGAHHWYSHLHTILGRGEASLEQALLALELDPLDLSMATHLAWHYYYAREYDLAIQEARKALELERNAVWPYTILGSSYDRKGLFDQAIEAAERAAEMAPGIPMALADLGHAYASAGREADARRQLDRLAERAAEGHVPPHTIAFLHVGLGENDQALEWLERAFAERSDFLPYIGAEPFFDPLHGDPRFDGLLRRIGLPS